MYPTHRTNRVCRRGLEMWPFSSNTPPKQDPNNDNSVRTALTSQETSTRDDSPMRTPSQIIQQRQEKLERLEWLGYSDERLGMIFPLRAVLLMGVSFMGGASLGVANGSAVAADRYRAENAHRLPSNQNGWYLYHKSKNYHALLGGMKEGAKFGSILMGWAFMFMVTEEVVDQSRARIFAKRDDERAIGQRDAASTVISAMSVAGLYSWKQGFDQYAAARTARMALKYSLVFGLIQDALATLRGSRPAYIDWLAKRTLRRLQDSDAV